MLGYIGLMLCMCPVLLALFTTGRWTRSQRAWAAWPCWIALALVTVVLVVWWIWGIDRGWAEVGMPAALAVPIIVIGLGASAVQIVEWVQWRAGRFTTYVPRHMQADEHEQADEPDQAAEPD